MNRTYVALFLALLLVSSVSAAVVPKGKIETKGDWVRAYAKAYAEEQGWDLPSKGNVNGWRALESRVLIHEPIPAGSKVGDDCRYWRLRDFKQFKGVYVRTSTEPLVCMTPLSKKAPAAKKAKPAPVIPPVGDDCREVITTGQVLEWECHPSDEGVEFCSWNPVQVTHKTTICGAEVK